MYYCIIEFIKRAGGGGGAGLEIRCEALIGFTNEL